jgi:hypothetical protein
MMRRLSVVGTCMVVLAAGCVVPAVPSWAGDEPEPTASGETALVSSVFATARVLRDQGFSSVEVGYPVGTNSVVVRFTPPPAADSPGAADAVAAAVWGHEPRFDSLIVQADGQTTTESYDDLAARFPPRSADLNRVSVVDMQEIGKIGPDLLNAIDKQTGSGAYKGFWSLVLVFGALVAFALITMMISFVIRHFAR